MHEFRTEERALVGMTDDHEPGRVRKKKVATDRHQFDDLMGAMNAGWKQAPYFVGSMQLPQDGPLSQIIQKNVIDSIMFRTGKDGYANDPDVIGIFGRPQIASHRRKTAVFHFDTKNGIC